MIKKTFENQIKQSADQNHLNSIKSFQKYLKPLVITSVLVNLQFKKKLKKVSTFLEII